MLAALCRWVYHFSQLTQSLHFETATGQEMEHKQESTAKTVRALLPAEPAGGFPLVVPGCDVVAGFGRGSSDLGIPTANVPLEQLPTQVRELPLGVYFGFAKLWSVEHPPEWTARQTKEHTPVEYNYGASLQEDNGDLGVLPMVLSIGENPFYHNTFKTVELHILHKFTDNFYGAKVKFNILGFIRDELDYTTKEALINDINIDIDTARETLQLPNYSKYKEQLL